MEPRPGFWGNNSSSSGSHGFTASEGAWVTALKLMEAEVLGSSLIIEEMVPGLRFLNHEDREF